MIHNQLKTVLLLGALSGLLLFLGNFFGGSQGLLIAFIFSLCINGLAYFFSDKLVLRIYHAKPLNKHQYGDIYRMVHDLSRTMHIPMPTLWIIDHPSANAFATGRNPAHASVAFTRSILEMLNEQELRGVIAHELSHIKNRDTLISTIAVTIATCISYVAQMMQYRAMWGSRDRDRNNPLVLFVLALIVPIAATLLQLAISRSREYFADETGAHICKDPMALAHALEKLHAHTTPHATTTQESTSSLFIVNPFRKSNLFELFSTHPPLHKRIQRLRQLAEKKEFQ